MNKLENLFANGPKREEDRIKVTDIFKKLKKARIERDIEQHLRAINDIMENQILIIQFKEFLALEFGYMVDVLYDYGRDFSPLRDETLIFKAATEWLSFDQEKRKKFTAQIMRNVNFKNMDLKQIKRCFEPVGEPKFSKVLRDYLYRQQEELEKANLLDTDAVFHACKEERKDVQVKDNKMKQADDTVSHISFAPK